MTYNKLQNLIKPTNSQAFDQDVIIVKRIGNTDKIIYLTSCCQPGVIIPKSKKGSSFKEKLSNNLSRARSTITEIALCNKWDYFVTLTIDKNKFDRYKTKEYIKALTKWLNNYNRNGNKVKYLLIPEFHKDGAIHMHGLLSNIPINDLCINEYGYLDWIPYHDKFGFISIGKIRNNIAIAHYISKYITKELATTIQECNSHLYFASKGLSRAERIYKASNSSLLCEPTFKNDYVSLVSIDNHIFDFHDFIDSGHCIYEFV